MVNGGSVSKLGARSCNCMLFKWVKDFELVSEEIRAVDYDVAAENVLLIYHLSLQRLLLMLLWTERRNSNDEQF